MFHCFIKLCAMKTCIHDLSTRWRLHLGHLPQLSPLKSMDRRLNTQHYEHEDSEYQYSLFIFTFFISESWESSLSTCSFFLLENRLLFGLHCGISFVFLSSVIFFHMVYLVMCSPFHLCSQCTVTKAVFLTLPEYC